MRTEIHTTNAIASMNARVRKAVKSPDAPPAAGIAADLLPGATGLAPWATGFPVHVLLCRVYTSSVVSGGELRADKH